MQMEAIGMPRLLQPGYQLLTSVLLAALMFLLSICWIPYTSFRIVLAWDTGAAILLTLTAIMMWRTEPLETISRARKEETSNIIVLLLTILIVAAALGAIGYGLPQGKTISRNLRIF